MNRRITTALFLMAATMAPASAGPKPPTVSEVKALAFNPETGAVVPFTQETAGWSVVLAVKIGSGTPGETVQVSFTATQDGSAGYNEVNKKAPPKRKIKTTSKARIDAESQWIMLPLAERVHCYDDSKVSIGKSTMSIEFPGSCF